MRDLPLISDSNLIAGLEHAEDAGVYKISADLALVQTVDFFTPTVDDPYIFGQIAAANALNDVYAMGANPITALNIVCFPIKTMDVGVLKEVLSGGLSKIREAGALLVGGHSVEDNEIKYGLAVTGLIAPDKVLFNRGAKPGDGLLLTKPLGTGIVSTALKGGAVNQRLLKKAVECMTELNKKAAEIITREKNVHSCTDITGFGFLGHACETIDGEKVGLRINSAAVPVLDGIRELVEEGWVPGGLYRNLNFRRGQIDVADTCPAWLLDVFFDPQTAGGLFFSLPLSQADALLEKMRRAGITDVALVGEVIADHPGRIYVY